MPVKTRRSPALERLLQLIAEKAEYKNLSVTAYLEKCGLSNNDRQNMKRYNPSFGKAIEVFEAIKATDSEVLWVCKGVARSSARVDSTEQERVFSKIQSLSKEILDLSNRYFSRDAAMSQQSQQVRLCLENQRLLQKALNHKIANVDKVNIQAIQKEIFQESQCWLNESLLKLLLLSEPSGCLYIFPEELNAILGWTNVMREELTDNQSCLC